MQHAAKRKISKVSDKFLALFLIWRLKTESMYGYRLMEEVSTLGSSRRSTVYAILTRLENLGFIKGRNVEVGKRTRKMYRTAAKGTELFERVKKTRITGPVRGFFEALLVHEVSHANR